MRKIFCVKCNRYLGEIRDAKLLKGIKFSCSKCEIERVVSDVYQETGTNNPFKYIFGDF